MPILSAIGSHRRRGAKAPSICCLTSVSVAPSIAVAPDPALEVGSFVPVAAIEDDGTILYSILTCSLPDTSPIVYPG